MKRRYLPLFAGLTAGLLACGCGGGGGGAAAGGSGGCGAVVTANTGPVVPPPVDFRSLQSGTIWIPPSSVVRPGERGVAHTNHLILIPSQTRSGPSGLTPAMVNKAYGGNSGGAGAIAIIDAFDYPSALDDFNTFSTAFGLPTETSCFANSSGNTVFQKVYASGSKPKTDPDWAQESALDIEWAHAMAPGAKIYLVEGASASLSDLMAAVGIAKNLPNVHQISMSFGGPEGASSFTSFDGKLVGSGITFFAATGDMAGEKDFPALSKNVVAVGGTTLNVDATGTWISEVVWKSTGCGPSAFEPRPSFQDSVMATVGSTRGACDISADADPTTGVSVYDSLPASGISGWFIVGGTSAATPIIAGIVNCSGVAFSSSQALNAAFYGEIGGSALHDVTSGSVTDSSNTTYKALNGWDFPSGVGTPNGLAQFLAGP